MARKEFRRGWRSRTLWALAAVATLLVAGSVLTQSRSPRVGLLPPEAAIYSAVTLLSLVYPLVVLAGSYGAIAGELDSGSARYLLGLPVSRAAVLLGTLLGRVAVAWLAVLVAFAVGAAALLVRFGRLPVVDYLVITALTLLFAAVWTAVGVGVSAFVRTRGRALAGALAAYFLLVVYWLFIPGVNPETLVSRFVEDLLGLHAMPALYQFVFRAPPSTAYSFAATRLLFGGRAERFFLGPRFLTLVLLGWLAVPTAIGYLRFRRVELT